MERKSQTLEKQVQQLEKSLAESKANANIIPQSESSGDPAFDLLSQKEASDGQVLYNRDHLIAKPNL